MTGDENLPAGAVAMPSPGFVDRLVGVFSPRAAAYRNYARWAAWMLNQQMARYKGADENRLNADWLTDNRDINTILATKLPRLRARSRWLFRNNPYAGGVMNTYLNYIVGTGLSLQMQARRYEWQTEDGKDVVVPVEMEAWNDWTEEQFGAWGEDCDVASSPSCPDAFVDLQGLVLRKLIEDGEALIYYVEDFGLPGVPLRLQVLEPDCLDLAKYEHEGNPVILGVEVDRRSWRPLAYWVTEESGSGRTLQLGSRRIPAEKLLHLYERLRPGQLRGVPWLAVVTQRFYDLDEYADAELIGNKIAACFSVFITSPTGTEIPLLAKASQFFPKDADGNTVANLAPGIIGAGLPPGSEVNVVAPQKPGGTFGMFTRHHLTAMAAGTQHGLSYYAMTRDTQGTTFAGGRQAQLMDYQGYRPVQAWLARKFCGPVLRRWMDVAVQVGAVTAPGYFANAPGPRFWQRHGWMPPGWTWGINPLQEVNASKASMRSGITTHGDECAALGYDGKTQLRKLARERREAKRLGLVMDSNPADDTKRAETEDLKPEADVADPEE